MTEVEIEYITCPDIYQYIEQSLRGGVTTINKRYFEANNKYLKDFDPKKPSSFIMYVDANNLYGVGLSGKLPIRDFRWLSSEEINNFNLDIDSEGDKCYTQSS